MIKMQAFEWKNYDFEKLVSHMLSLTTPAYLLVKLTVTLTSIDFYIEYETCHIMEQT